MTIISMLVFGAASAAAIGTIYATLKPDMARIIDLLKHGPVATTVLPAPVAVRSTVRNVTVRDLSRPARSPSRVRAAA